MPAALVYVQTTYQDDHGWPVFCPTIDAASELIHDWEDQRIAKGRDPAWTLIEFREALNDQGSKLINKD